MRIQVEPTKIQNLEDTNIAEFEGAASVDACPLKVVKI